MDRSDTMGDVSRDLVRTVDRAAALLRSWDLALPQREGGPEVWSPKQIVGHLIDSASTNHERFLRAQGRDDATFEGYPQEAWVDAQAYRDAPWPELVELWRLFNHHLARVIDRIPKTELERRRSIHSLHQMGWETVPQDEQTTLAYLVRDYVGHLKHHLRQIDPALANEPDLQRAGSVRRR